MLAVVLLSRCCFTFTYGLAFIFLPLLVPHSGAALCVYRCSPYWFGSRHGSTGVVLIMRGNAQKKPHHRNTSQKGLTSEWLSRLRPSSGFCCHPSTFLLCFRPKPFDRVLPQRGNFQHGNQALQQCSRGGHLSAVEQPAFFMFQSKDSFSNILTSAVETQTVTVCI